MGGNTRRDERVWGLRVLFNVPLGEECGLVGLWGTVPAFWGCGIPSVRAASNVGEGDDEAYGRSLAGREGVRVRFVMRQLVTRVVL